jgi:hypothetical protein
MKITGLPDYYSLNSGLCPDPDIKITDLSDYYPLINGLCPDLDKVHLTCIKKNRVEHRHFCHHIQ